MNAFLSVQTILQSAMREHFVLFLMRVYAELHPGEPPLSVGWYLNAISHALSEAATTDGTRLVINVPPRHLKSVAVSVAYTAWLLGRAPKIKIMVATYNEDQHDDQVDALSQFFEYHLKMAQSLLAPRDPRTGRVLYINRPNRIVRRDRQRIL